MEDLNIFDKVPTQEKRDYFKFVNIGDSVQGTYVERNDNSVDGYGHPQTLVSLKQKDGRVLTVSIRHSKVGLLKILDGVKLGEIIGFKFDGTKDNPGKQPTKFLRLVHDPKIVDQEWLNSRGTAQAAVNMAVPPVVSAPVSAPAGMLKETPVSTAPVNVDEEKIRNIIVFAKSKWGATDEASVKQMVMEKTGLAFIKINLDLILTRLEGLNK